MTDRLSDDRLQMVAEFDNGDWIATDTLLSLAEAASMARELVGLRRHVVELDAAASSAIGEALTLRAKLAAGPVMPELRWDGDYLRIGKIYVGVVEEEDDCDLCYGCFDDSRIISQVTEPEARAAVEAAARRALGWVSASDELPTADAIPTPANAADGAVFAEQTEIEP